MIINDLLHIKKYFVKGKVNSVPTWLHSGQSLTILSCVFKSFTLLRYIQIIRKILLKVFFR